MQRFIAMMGIGLCAAFLGTAHAKDLALSYFMGPAHPMNKAVFTPFAERLEKVSNGALTVTLYSGGALNSSPPKQYSILLDGVADIAFHLPGYTAQLFPVTTAITTPGICTTAIECTQALWRGMDVIEKEYDAKLLALWTTEPGVLFSKDKPIRTIDDMSGMIVRIGSAQNIPFMEALGASAVSQPVNVINQNLQNGVVDVLYIEPGAGTSFKLNEPANYITTNIPGGGSSFALLMNKTVWNGLSDQEKKWVDAVAGEDLSLEAAKAYEQASIKSLNAAAEYGVEIIELSPEERQLWENTMQPAMNAWFETDLGYGLSGAQVHKLMRTGD